MIKYIYYLLISLFLVFIAQSVLSPLGILSNLNLLLVVLVFITVIFGFNLGFIFAVLIGFLANIYSFLPLGSLIISYLAIIAVINFFYKNVFINFSFYTILILILIATFLNFFIIYLLNLFFYFLGVVSLYVIVDKIFLLNLLWQFLLNLLFITILYFIAKFTIKKLNLAFLIKK
ncbi:MAG TPA: hypothetical protein ENN28_03495 [Candidatus Uhrbacteria bacterium]|nr:hypothetical protein [Candidatus Uhrbacteria bacterium]